MGNIVLSIQIGCMPIFSFKQSLTAMLRITKSHAQGDHLSNAFLYAHGWLITNDIDQLAHSQFKQK